MDLFRFIDWVMRLPLELEERFWNEHEHYEMERGMKYVTSVERIGVQKGVKQGVKQGKVTLVKNLLVHQFKELPGWVEKLLTDASPEDLDRWSIRLLNANSLEDVFTPA